MLYLCINSASKINQLFLIEEKNIIARQEWAANRDETQKLLPAIEKLLFSVKKNFDDLSHIFAVTGPGGFTSLRVSLTIANTLAYALGIKIGGMLLFDYLASQTDEKDYFLVHSASKKEVFIQEKGLFSKKFPEIKLIPFTELVSFIKKKSKIALLGELVSEQKQILTSKNVSFLETDQQKIPDLLKKVLWKKEGILEPYYGRNALIN